MSILNLRPGEETVYEKWGSYFKKSFLSYAGDNAVVEVTNQRIAGRYKTIVMESKENFFEAELSEVADVKKCSFVFFGFIPMGVKVTMKNGDIHIFSVMGRGKLIEAVAKGMK